MNGAVSNYLPYIHTSFGLVLKNPTKHKIDKSCIIGCEGTRSGIHPFGHCTLVAQSTCPELANGPSVFHTYLSVIPPAGPNPSACNATAFITLFKKQGKSIVFQERGGKEKLKTRFQLLHTYLHAAPQCHSLQGQQGQGNPATKTTE